jgi:ABC-2 type transport system permease protein
MRAVDAWLRCFRVQLKVRVVNPFSWFGVIVQPVVFAVIGLVLFTTSGRTHGASYAVLGGGLVGLWSATLFNAGYDIESERWTGTLEELFGSATPIGVILAGKVAASLVPALASFVLTLAVALVAFHQVVSVVAPVPLAVSLLLTFAAFYVMGFLLATVFASVRITGGFTNSFEIPLYLLCGFMFPASVLPGWVQPLSWALAPTWTIRAMYAATGQGGPASYAAWWAVASALIAANALLARLLLRVVRTRLRVSGELATV